MIYHKYLVIGLLLMSLCACKKTIVDGYTAPEPLVFVLLNKQGKNMLININTPLLVSSYDYNGKLAYLTYSNGFKPILGLDSTINFPYRFVYSNLEPAIISSQGIKEWYLELNGKTDTLHYDVQHTRPNDRFNQYDVVSVLFDGKPVNQITTVGGNICYLLQRKH